MVVPDDFDALLAPFSGTRCHDCVHQPLPSELDQDVRAFVPAYQAHEPDGGISLVTLVGEHVDALECFAERQAVVAGPFRFSGCTSDPSD